MLFAAAQAPAQVAPLQLPAAPAAPEQRMGGVKQVPTPDMSDDLDELLELDAPPPAPPAPLPVAPVAPTPAPVRPRAPAPAPAAAVTEDVDLDEFLGGTEAVDDFDDFEDAFGGLEAPAASASNARLMAIEDFEQAFSEDADPLAQLGCGAASRSQQEETPAAYLSDQSGQAASSRARS